METTLNITWIARTSALGFAAIMLITLVASI
jgi:hypothetical protein